MLFCGTVELGLARGGRERLSIGIAEDVVVGHINGGHCANRMDWKYCGEEE